MFVCMCVCVRSTGHTVCCMKLIFLPRYLSILIKMQRQSFCSNSEIWGSYAPFSILSKNQFSQKFETAAATKFKLSICIIRPMSPDSLFFEKNDFLHHFLKIEKMAPTSTTIKKKQTQLGFDPSTSHMVREHATIWAIEKKRHSSSVFSLYVCLCVCLYACAVQVTPFDLWS